MTEENRSRAITLGELLSDDGKPRRMPTASEADRLARLLKQRSDRFAGNDARTISQIMDDWFDEIEAALEESDRWPVIRTGERDTIPWLLRLSIYRRDCYSCVECGFSMFDNQIRRDWAELDHCIPWSAGGPDDSDNLRLLCNWCNQARSNHVDHAHARIYRPTTWWCPCCWSIKSHDRHHYQPWRDGTYLGTPLFCDDDAVTTPVDLAFCAFCEHHCESPYPLIGATGRALIAEATRNVRYEETA